MSGKQVIQVRRLPLLAAAILALLGSIWLGLLRMGWQWPVWESGLTGAHAPLMISGFFGTLISLERAVALRRGWPYAGPALTGIGGLLLAAGVRGILPPLLMMAGSLWLVLVFITIVRMHFVRYTVVMGAGALAWAVGNALWMTGLPVYRVAPWWAAFLILTIAGERLELGRLARLSRRVENLFLAAVFLYAAGLALSVLLPDLGIRLASLALVGLAGWLSRYDIARKTIRQTGLPRFAAAALLSGYVWLAAGGLMGAWVGAAPAGLFYDAYLHALFLGFVFSMIFAHAPIIFPAVLNLPVKFTRLFYLPLALLHGSLLVRVVGDLLLLPQLRAWGGLLNGVTILVFLVLTGRSLVSSLLEKFRSRKAGLNQPRDTGDPGASPNWPRRMWLAALVAFLLAALTGALMRYWMLGGMPSGISYPNVRHAHSHLMFFSWVTPALMALIAARLPALTGRPVRPGMLWGAAGAFFFGVLSYLPYYYWGYQPVDLGSARMPVAVIFSSLSTLAWYVFAVSFFRNVRGAPYSRPVKLWSAALVLLFLASLGAGARAALSMMKIEDAFLSAASVHLFLDLFTGGWAVVGLLGVIYASKPALVKSVSGWEDWLLFIGLPLSFLLGAPVEVVPTDLRTWSGIGGLMAAGGLFLHMRRLWPHFRGDFWSGWGLPLSFLLVKAGMDGAASLAPLARWGEAVGLRLIYLHTSLLGFVTLALVVAGVELWYPAVKGRVGMLSGSILLLLASLLPFTRLWPASLTGVWQLWSAFYFSIGPLLAVIILLASLPAERRRKEPVPVVGSTDTV